MVLLKNCINPSPLQKAKKVISYFKKKILTEFHKLLLDQVCGIIHQPIDMKTMDVIEHSPH